MITNAISEIVAKVLAARRIKISIISPKLIHVPFVAVRLPPRGM
jgi:hypothetical protein